MSIQQLSVFIENKPGSLESFTKVLRKYHLDMNSLMIAESRDFGILRVLVDDPYEASKVLRDEGYIIKLTPVIAAQVSDEPGAMISILETLLSHDINVEYTYAYVAPKDKGAFIILKTNDPEKSEKLLGNAGVHLLQAEDMD